MWTMADGWPFRTIVCTSAGPPKGTIVFLNGRADFLEKYLESYNEFLSWGYAVASLDWRGQGLSGRLAGHPHMGHLSDFNVLINDLAAWVHHLSRQLPPPLYLVAHSMGGHIGLRFLREHPGFISQAVLLSPMLGLRTGYIPKPVVRRIAGWMVQRGRGGELALTQRLYGPRHRSPFRQILLTGDRDRFLDEHWWIQQIPGLALGGVTYGWLDAAFRSIDQLNTPGYLEGIQVPIHILMPEFEQVVDPVAARHIAARLPHCRLMVVPGGRHELLRDIEPVRSTAMNAIRAALG